MSTFDVETALPVVEAEKPASVVQQHQQDQAHVLEWNVVSLHRKARRILSNIVGRVETGNLLTLFGPSGCGKTTLIECLSLRDRNFEGAVHLDGNALGSDYFSRTAVVYQMEMFFGFLTPREHLTFHAISRMSGRSSRAEIRDRVSAVIKELDLDKCADTIIGGVDAIYQGKGLSGGERKRLSIATELLLRPLVLFLDEPTSGLDSVRAESVVGSLRTVADQGTIVISSLHSPSSSLADHFTHVLFLTADGRVAFQGPYKDLMGYLQGINRPVPQGFFTVDFMMQQLSSRADEVPESLTERMDMLVDHFKKSGFSIPSPLAADGAHMKYKPVTGANASLLTLIELNVWRMFTSVRRNRVNYVAWVGVNTTIGIVFGVLYLGSARDSWRNMLGILFLSSCANLFLGGVGAAMVVPSEWPIITREYLAGANAVGPYILSKVAYNVPYLPAEIIGATLWFWLSGLGSSFSSYLFVIATNILATYATAGICCFLSSFSANPSVGISLMPAVNFPMITFAGVFYQRSLIPSYFVWIERISIVNYSFSALLGSLVHGLSPQDKRAILAFTEVDPSGTQRSLLYLAVIAAVGYMLCYASLRVRLYLSKQSL